jgi:predicted DNA-binding antitoxin AbrB/MazE fold protein
MIHDIDAIYDHGVLRPVVPLELPEGARVRLRIEEENGAEEAKKQTDGELPTLLERMKDFVGIIDDLPEDSSINLDYYLYGKPKR